MTELQHQIHQGAWIDPSKLSLGEYLTKKWLPQKQPSVSANTFERYEEIVRLHLVPALGATPVRSLKPLQIQEYYTEALQSGRRDGKGGLAGKMVRQHHAVLRRALADGVKWQVIPLNAALSVDVPKSSRNEMKTLTIVEARDLQELVQSTRWEMPVFIALRIGLRRGEVLALRWSDIDFDGNEVYVRRTLECTRAGLTFKEPKTPNSIGSVKVGPSVIIALRRHKAKQAQSRLLLGEIYQNNDLVCAREDGMPINPDNFSRDWAAFIKAKVFTHIRFHDLRHTFVTIQAAQGIHPKTISERARHSIFNITMDLYGHVLPSMASDAARLIDEALDG